MSVQTPEIRTYRGRNLEELIPRIRDELGPDAIILREREGLTGGLGGFFAQRCVEVDVQAGGPLPGAVDFYDDEDDAVPEPELLEWLDEVAPALSADPEPAFEPTPALPAPVAVEPAPVVVEPAPVAAAVPAAPPRLTFGERLEQARRQHDAAAKPPRVEHAELDPVAAGALARELVGRGLSEAWAHELIVSASAHLTPFAEHGSLRDAVRAGVAAALAAPAVLPCSGAAVAFIGAGGAGKTSCAAAMATAYAGASTLEVSVLSPAEGGMRTLLAGRGIPVHTLRGLAAAEAVDRGREQGLVIIDTPAVSPLDRAGTAALGAQLAPLGLDGVYLVLPATLSASAARGLLDGLAVLRPSALIITHADETDELGIVAELAYQSSLPIAFIHEGPALEHSLRPADPARVAARVLP